MRAYAITILAIVLLASHAHAEDKSVVDDSTTTNFMKMKFKRIPAGTFQMGAMNSDSEADDQGPTRQVRISRDFFLGVTEVTQRQWQTVMGTQPWRGREHVKEGANFPAVYVDWDGADEFCKRLGKIERARYRLPTEAEWEYACRAGTTTKYSFGDDAKQLGDYAWFGATLGDGNTTKARFAHPVASKRANPWGLYDMHGNVWEWCEDRYAPYASTGSVTDPRGPAQGPNRVNRGGSWMISADKCESATRRSTAAGFRGMNLGFRVIQIPPPVR